MNISLIKILPLLLGSLALTAQAAQITGQINIQSGSVVLTPNVLGAVTAVGPSTNGIVTSVEGSYPVALLNDVVAFKAFNVAVGAQAITSLWSVTDVLATVGSGFNYTFDLGAITSVVQTATNLFINGSGTLKSNDPGLSATAGLWSYGINSSNSTPTSGVFSFQSNNSGVAAAVADGGNTLVMIGVGLMGLVGYSRKFHRTA